MNENCFTTGKQKCSKNPISTWNYFPHGDRSNGNRISNSESFETDLGTVTPSEKAKNDLRGHASLLAPATSFMPFQGVEIYFSSMHPPV